MLIIRNATSETDHESGNAAKMVRYPQRQHCPPDRLVSKCWYIVVLHYITPTHKVNVLLID